MIIKITNGLKRHYEKRTIVNSINFNEGLNTEAHERPEAMEEGSVMMVGLEKLRIFQGIKILSSQKKSDLMHVSDYNMKNVSKKIIRIILSYTDYINRNIWKKY